MPFQINLESNQNNIGEPKTKTQSANDQNTEAKQLEWKFTDTIQAAIKIYKHRITYHRSSQLAYSAGIYLRQKLRFSVKNFYFVHNFHAPAVKCELNCISKAHLNRISEGLLIFVQLNRTTKCNFYENVEHMVGSGGSLKWNKIEYSTRRRPTIFWRTIKAMILCVKNWIMSLLSFSFFSITRLMKSDKTQILKILYQQRKKNVWIILKSYPRIRTSQCPKSSSLNSL